MCEKRLNLRIDKEILSENKKKLFENDRERASELADFLPLVKTCIVIECILHTFRRSLERMRHLILSVQTS